MTNMTTILAKYRARLESHKGQPTFSTQVADSDLVQLLDSAETAAAPRQHYVTKYAQDTTGEWYAVTIKASGSGNDDAVRFAAIFGHENYQYWAPDGFDAR